ncbi:hypothetical protein M3D75_14515 [Microbacterium enclense]|uniref:hypothetical protein n=1 Tax=Microbacterium enclense TaxID=993073 RepID=UPI0021A79724|nr:hypothetical protein [Microbacterium enclense]MCT2087333.1 hypothetical protein [Microbacterium enclense]
MTVEVRRRPTPPPSPRQVIADARARIASAAGRGSEPELREVQQTMARLTVHSLAGRDPGPAYDYALVSVEAEDELRLAIAKRVYPTAKGRKSWRNPIPVEAAS